MTDHGTLEIRSVGKRFDVAGQTVEALSGINLSVAPGEFVSIVGASGCGKVDPVAADRRPGAGL